MALRRAGPLRLGDSMLNKAHLVKMTAMCYLVVVLSAASSACKVDPAAGITLVAPLYVASEHFTSTLVMRNGSANEILSFVTLCSLEGAETGRKPTILPPHSSTTVDVDVIQAVPHRFGALGSIMVIIKTSMKDAVSGQLTVASRELKARINFNENLQRLDQVVGMLRVASVRGSSSVPVIAIHSLSDLAEHVSVVCSEETGEQYESELMLPAHMTFLVNGCIRGRSDSRTYSQLLGGDAGAMRKNMTIKISTASSDSAISVWAFAVTNVGVDVGVQLKGIEFVAWDPELEPPLGLN